MLLASLLFFSSISSAQAPINLDAPMRIDPPTIRSEIQRGMDASFDCELKTAKIDILNTSMYLDCVERVKNENRQKMGRNFEAFDAGLWAWTRDNLRDSYKNNPTSRNSSILDVAIAGTNGAEKALRISDDVVEMAMKRN